MAINREVLAHLESSSKSMERESIQATSHEQGVLPTLLRAIQEESVSKDAQIRALQTENKALRVKVDAYAVIALERENRELVSRVSVNGPRVEGRNTQSEARQRCDLEAELWVLRARVDALERSSEHEHRVREKGAEEFQQLLERPPDTDSSTYMKLAARYKKHPAASEPRPNGVDNKSKRKVFLNNRSEEQKEEAITDSDEMAMTWEGMKSEEVQVFGLNGPSTCKHRHTSAQHDKRRRVDSHDMKAEPQPNARCQVSSEINSLADAITHRKPWDLMYKHRPRFSHSFQFKALDDAAQGWVKQVCEFQYQYRRALWERGR